MCAISGRFSFQAINIRASGGFRSQRRSFVRACVRACVLGLGPFVVFLDVEAYGT